MVLEVQKIINLSIHLRWFSHFIINSSSGCMKEYRLVLSVVFPQSIADELMVSNLVWT